MPRHQLELPALYGSTPLGFLAALGALHLTHHLLDQAPQLSWSGPDAPAVLHTHQPFTHESLAALLATQLPAQPEKDALAIAPGILDQPRHTSPGAPNDPLRMPIQEALGHLRIHAQAERNDDDNRAAWFTSLINPLSATPGKTEESRAPKQATKKSSQTIYTRTTPFFGRTGRMTLPNNWATAAQHCISNPHHIHAALTHWQRVDGYAGANLDHSSLGDAHMVSHGKPTQQGIPGATWLALHGFAAFRLVGNRNRPHATSWTTTNAFTWPLWRPTLTTTALTTLLEHPAIHTHNNPETLENLGVIAIYTAPRTRLPQGDGPLSPGHRVAHQPRNHKHTTKHPNTPKQNAGSAFNIQS
ncbi:type I-G CRISPR-associated protein, Cas3-extension family [Streptomyces niveus]|uniref:type I-G CRISPR-associated protein, Cas3-extension family n=1 Tax=Streptomyces niveus TaxID=193462 RepID=UPI00340B8E72